MYCRADCMLYILHTWCIYYVWNIHATLLPVEFKEVQTPNRGADPQQSIWWGAWCWRHTAWQTTSFTHLKYLLMYYVGYLQCIKSPCYSLTCWVQRGADPQQSTGWGARCWRRIAWQTTCFTHLMCLLMYYAGYVLCLQSPRYSLTCWVQRGVDPQQSTGWGARCWRRTAGQHSWSRCCPGCWDPWPLWW